MNPLNIVYGVLGLALVTAVGVYVYRCEDAKDFKDKAVVLAEAARDKAIKQMVQDRKAKEFADAQHAKSVADLADANKRLRDERARSSRVPAAPAGSRRPDLACFDRAELERALSGFVEGTAGIVAEGDQSRLALDAAKNWAKGVSSTP